ncbi:hypothetical protein AYL99_03312 [Fonsecaea erecta]|uniref:Dystroglycan-type cadherin-like domain-containing protein n=1 Tax=Fonsecaea erecta TaxID=1367422 RepID=A0A178ZNR1_9EURO|nr:hypothetical protein AYL99_03312 [Fonsecaea erecta]OAP61111.1 hypothetical protein AYL99_03312 [Fonsecaea erecta]
MYLTEFNKPLLAFWLAAILDFVAAAPELAFPVNSQVPPVAYVSQPYDFVFSADTFTSNAPQISYTIADGPEWLNLDSASREFRGVPNQSDLGTTTLQLVASDLTGQLSTSVTFVVLESPTLTLNSPLLPQLEQSGFISPPNSLLVHPQQSFHLAFERQTFSGATLDTKYYAVSADNTPLPPWVQFDESHLEFSGTTPGLVSPLAESQMSGLRLIASNVPGFAELILDFQIVISRRVLAFSTASQHIRVSAGDQFQTMPLRPFVTLNGGPVTDDQIVSIDANVPAWIELDREEISLSGTPDGSVSITITVTVMDIYHDVANATIFLENTGNSNVSLGIIGKVNVTAGEYFSYNWTTPASSPWVRAIAALGNAASWLDFNTQTWTLSGVLGVQLEIAEGVERTSDSAFAPLPANPRLSILRLSALTNRFSAAGSQSQQEDSTTNTNAIPTPHVIGLPDRRSGAGHGAGILVSGHTGLDRTSCRDTWTSNPLSDRRRTTLVLDSFPAPPVKGATTARTVSQTRKSGPVLRDVLEDGNQPLSFEEQRQKWHTERARARLEGSARFSNAGSARMMISPRTKWLKSTPTLADRGLRASTSTARESKVKDIQAFREHSWPRWPGFDPEAPKPARMGRLVPSYQGNTPALRAQLSIASSGQFDSATSSDSCYLEDENPAMEEPPAEAQQWPANHSSQSLPRLPFNPVSRSQENTRNNEFSDAKQQGWFVEGESKRPQDRRRGSFRFI